MTSCPEELVLRIWGFWKTVSWEIEIGRCSQATESLPLGHRELISLPLRHVVGVLQISTDRDLKHRKMRSVFVGSDSMDSLIRIVSLLVSKNWSQKLINRSYLNNGVCLCIYICIVYVSRYTTIQVECPFPFFSTTLQFSVALIYLRFLSTIRLRLPWWLLHVQYGSPWWALWVGRKEKISQRKIKVIGRFFQFGDLFLCP